MTMPTDKSSADSNASELARGASRTPSNIREGSWTGRSRTGLSVWRRTVQQRVEGAAQPYPEGESERQRALEYGTQYGSHPAQAMRCEGQHLACGDPDPRPLNGQGGKEARARAGD